MLQNIVDFKAKSFLTEQNTSTMAYEVKAVRALWDPSLSIPGTNRRGGWRCPVGTRYGGQITDRFGRSCGWGVARRIANQISDIGQRLENVDDARRGRRIARRERRILQRLNPEGGGAGRIEQGLRGVAERLDGGDAPSPRGARRRTVVARPPSVDAPDTPRELTPAPPAPRAPRRRRAPNLRESEQRRMDREIDQPGAPRTGEAPARPARNRGNLLAAEPLNVLEEMRDELENTTDGRDSDDYKRVMAELRRRNAPARPARRRQEARPRGDGNLRESEQRRMDREIAQPGAPRTGEAPARRRRRAVVETSKTPKAPTQQEAKPKPQVEPKVVKPRRPTAKPKAVGNPQIVLDNNWTKNPDGIWERDGYKVKPFFDADGKLERMDIEAPDGGQNRMLYGGGQRNDEINDAANQLYRMAVKLEAGRRAQPEQQTGPRQVSRPGLRRGVNIGKVPQGFRKTGDGRWESRDWRVQQNVDRDGNPVGLTAQSQLRPREVVSGKDWDELVAKINRAERIHAELQRGDNDNAARSAEIRAEAARQADAILADADRERARAKGKEVDIDNIIKMNDRNNMAQYMAGRVLNEQRLQVINDSDNYPSDRERLQIKAREAKSRIVAADARLEKIQSAINRGALQENDYIEVRGRRIKVSQLKEYISSHRDGWQEVLDQVGSYGGPNDSATSKSGGWTRGPGTIMTHQNGDIIDKAIRGAWFVVYGRPAQTKDGFSSREDAIAWHKENVLNAAVNRASKESPDVENIHFERLLGRLPPYFKLSEDDKRGMAKVFEREKKIELGLLGGRAKNLQEFREWADKQDKTFRRLRTKAMREELERAKRGLLFEIDLQNRDRLVDPDTRKQAFSNIATLGARVEMMQSAILILDPDREDIDAPFLTPEPVRPNVPNPNQAEIDGLIVRRGRAERELRDMERRGARDVETRAQQRRIDELANRIAELGDLRPRDAQGGIVTRTPLPTETPSALVFKPAEIKVAKLSPENEKIVEDLLLEIREPQNLQEFGRHVDEMIFNDNMGRMAAEREYHQLLQGIIEKYMNNPRVDLQEAIKAARLMYIRMNGDTDKRTLEQGLAADRLEVERLWALLKNPATLDRESVRVDRAQTIAKRMERIARREQLLQNYDLFDREIDKAVKRVEQGLNFNADAPGVVKPLDADVAKKIKSQINIAIKRRSSKNAEYMKERYGSAKKPFEDMTPEKWRAMPADAKKRYLEQAYGHAKIKGANGRFYNAVATVRVGASTYVSVQFNEIDANGRVIRSVGESGRTINVSSGYVKNDTMFIRSKLDRGADIQTIYNQHAFLYLKAIGVTKAKVSPAVQDGQYVWARVGFNNGDLPRARLQSFEKALYFYENFGAGGLINSSAEYFRIKSMVNQTIAGKGFSHQEWIFAIDDPANDKIRREFVKHWFITNAPLPSGVFSFAKNKIGGTATRARRPRAAPRSNA